MDVYSNVIHGGPVEEVITLYCPAYLRTKRLKCYQRLTNTYKMPKEYVEKQIQGHNGYLYSHYGVVRLCAFDMTDFETIDDLLNLAASFLYYALLEEIKKPSLVSFIADLRGLTTKEIERLSFGLPRDNHPYIRTLEDALVTGFLLLTKFRSHIRTSPYLYDVINLFTYEAPPTVKQFEFAEEKMSGTGKNKTLIFSLPPVRPGDVQRVKRVELIEIKMTDIDLSNSRWFLQFWQSLPSFEKLFFELDELFELYDQKQRKLKIKAKKLEKLRFYLCNFLKFSDLTIEYVIDHGIKSLEDLEENIKQKEGSCIPARIRSEATRDFKNPQYVFTEKGTLCNGCWLSKNTKKGKNVCKRHKPVGLPPPVPSAPPENEIPLGIRRAEVNESLTENTLSPENIKECGICLSKKKSMAFIPCGHMVCDSKDCLKIQICHICRSPIENTIKVYID